MRTETFEAHRAAEGTWLVGALLDHTLDRGDYLTYLRSLYPVYLVLEHALEDGGQDPVLGRFCQRAVFRAPCIARDILALGAGAWHGAAAAAESTAYCSRIEAARSEGAHLLLAHAYVRHLGDLSGGQLMAPALRSCLGIGDRERGLDMLGFPGIPDIRAFRASFRSRLDDVEIDAQETEAMVAEANRAFALHVALVEALPRRASAGTEAR